MDCTKSMHQHVLQFVPLLQYHSNAMRSVWATMPGPFWCCISMNSTKAMAPFRLLVVLQQFNAFEPLGSELGKKFGLLIAAMFLYGLLPKKLFPPLFRCARHHGPIISLLGREKIDLWSLPLGLQGKNINKLEKPVAFTDASFFCFLRAVFIAPKKSAARRCVS